jgi:hypothetical protein
MDAQRSHDVGQRREHVLQDLRLLLQHADVGHQLLMLFVGGCRGRRGDREERGGGEDAENAVSHKLTLR